MRSWTLGRKVGAALALTVALAMLIAAVSVYALRQVVATKDRVIAVNAQNLIDAETLELEVEKSICASRGYLLTGDDSFVETMSKARAELLSVLGALRPRVDPDSLSHLDEIERSEAAHHSSTARLIAERKAGAALDVIARQFGEGAITERDGIEGSLEAFIWEERESLVTATREATKRSDAAIKLVSVIALAALIVAVAVATLLTRTMSRQIGSAIQHVQSSSAELHASANQQATGAKESATAMNEINTTISELLATSRQIAHSSQRVAQIAEETATSARSGDLTVQRSQEAVGGIKKHVDLIVAHMLDLGKKSQQIGGILEIINELAEQTNILAINATIEAAGAGESGKRFAVVADEIRKLADRVGGSTREIRGLIEEIRAAVNTTVMATEGGSKAVDAGTRQFSDVAVAFRQIAGLVGTTIEAAREIELSTKQQTTAVEQVNEAVASVAQATKEAEVSSNETVKTALQLAGLSKDLTRLIKATASA
jgi:methyl-accepting chemotaxis protein